LQPGETPAAAAVRECLEESGLDVEVIGELLRTTHQYEHGLLEIHFFDCHPIDNAQMPNAPFRWTPQAELSTLQFPEANAALTKVLAEM
jgi:8-oxo-dGTP pyrophosphatase MutT (NUDIX family)